MKRTFICFICLVCLLTTATFAAAPVILQNPVNFYIPQDATYPVYASFSVMSDGAGDTYQWQVTDDGVTWRNVTGTPSSTTSSFTVPIYETNADGSRWFRCIVSNTDGSTTSSAVSASAGVFVVQSLTQMVNWTTDVATGILGWVGECCEAIVTTPLLFFTIGFLALGGAIAIVSRLLARS